MGSDLGVWRGEGGWMCGGRRMSSKELQEPTMEMGGRAGRKTVWEEGEARPLYGCGRTGTGAGLSRAEGRRTRRANRHEGRHVPGGRPGRAPSRPAGGPARAGASAGRPPEQTGMRTGTGRRQSRARPRAVRQPGRHRPVPTPVRDAQRRFFLPFYLILT